MNEQFFQLLEKLSQKLGTTTEYLWGVLVNQANVSATIDSIFLLLTIIYGIVFFKLHFKFSEKIKDSDGYEENLYDKKEEWLILPMLIAAVFFIILVIKSIVDIENIISGFFNPEYWALNEILKLIK